MPREARVTSSIGVYHTILRGVNKQQIFECAEDYEHFVRILQRQCGLPVDTRPSSYNGRRNVELLQILSDAPVLEEEPVRHCFIYAWCLMGNHVHLLIKGADEEIGDVMKRIASSYVYYYNHKYDRVGHLFQERFKSQPVEDWDYFVTLLRYIHQNPLKPKLCSNLADYRWSSWREYLDLEAMPFSSVDVVKRRIDMADLSKLVYDMLDEEQEKGFIDVEVKPRTVQFTDEDAWGVLQELCGATNSSEFQALPRPLQKHVLYCAHEEGLGPTTLSRLTGVSYSVVQRATSAANEKLKRLKGYVAELSEEEEEFLDYMDEGEFLQNPEF